MKTLGKLLLSATALLAMFASTAQADVTIRITGSTAFRSAVHNALINILGGSGVTKAAYNGSNLAGANQAVFTGTIAGISGTVTVETDWTGSLSGLNALANNPTAGTGSGQLTFITGSAIPGTITTAQQTVAGTGLDVENSVPSSGTGSNPDGSVPPPFGLYNGPGGGVAVTASFTSPVSSFVDTSGATADIALSDSSPSSTPFSGAAISAQNVGVVPFVWVKCAAETGDNDYNTYKNLTNMTHEVAANLLATGYLTASDVTGNSADSGANILVSGRDEDSGTRFDALCEDYSDNPYATIQQFEFTGSNTTSGTVTGGSPQQSSLVLPVPSPASNTGGYNSGGTLAKWLMAEKFDANVGGYAVAYLSCSDAEALVAPFDVSAGQTAPSVPSADYVPGKALTYNGVTVSPAAVSSGAYQFWIFEHYILRTGSGAFASGSDQLTFSNKLFNQLKTADARVAGYLLSTVSATKSKECALIGAP